MLAATARQEPLWQVKGRRAWKSRSMAPMVGAFLLGCSVMFSPLVSGGGARQTCAASFRSDRRIFSGA